MKPFNKAVIGALGLLMSLLGPQGAGLAQDGQLSKIQGAWLETGMSCQEVYAKGTKGIAFRKPLSIFAPAFIVSGRVLRTPLASCRIAAIKPSGNRQVLLLGCANSVSTSDLSAMISVGSDGTLRRYFNDDDSTGSVYERCTP
jgi:hypothetical protein